jgi:hypothetical protein
MDDIKKIEKLKKRNLELEPIVSKGFEPFTDELEKHKEKNKAIFDEYFDNLEEIERLEWEQLSPKEQEERKEHRRLLDLKAQGKFPL